jgi:GH25 family lysozyme M1 (1,4-beta-N-acetylmuramidase)
MKLIDISRAQHGRIDWPRVRRAGYAGAIVQLVQGGDSGAEQRDRIARGRARVLELHAEGFESGVYAYAHPAPNPLDARDEGLRFAEAVDPIVDILTLVDFLDYEEFGAGTPTTPLEHLDWISRWAEESGAVRPGLYTGRARCHRLPPALSTWPLWCAWYHWGDGAPPDSERELLGRWLKHESISPWKRAALWQYSSHATVDGIDGRVDVNLVLDRQRLRRK